MMCCWLLAAASERGRHSTACIPVTADAFSWTRFGIHGNCKLKTMQTDDTVLDEQQAVPAVAAAGGNSDVAPTKEAERPNSGKEASNQDKLTLFSISRVQKIVKADKVQLTDSMKAVTIMTPLELV